MGLKNWERVRNDDPAYKACLVVATGSGAVAGIILGGAGSAATAGALTPFMPGLMLQGAALGFTAGYLFCPLLIPAIRRKFDLGQPLDFLEVRNAAEAMGGYAGVETALEAVRLVAVARAVAPAARGRPVCAYPAQAARDILGSISGMSAGRLA